MSVAFFFKKLIGFFFEPLGVVMMLIALSLYFLYAQKETKAKLFLFFALLMLFLFSYPPFSNMLVKNLENQYSKYEYKEDVAYIHVLGNGHNTDPSQPISSNLNATQTKRVLEGVIILKQHQNAKLIFTGYAGETDVANAIMSARLASALGVKEEQMIINPLPTDTREEAEFTKSVVGEKPFIIVTSASHMPRAMMLFGSYGMHPIAAPTNYYKDKFHGYFRKPSANDFYISTVAMHEYLGMVLAKLKNLL